MFFLPDDDPNSVSCTWGDDADDPVMSHALPCSTSFWSTAILTRVFFGLCLPWNVAGNLEDGFKHVQTTIHWQKGCRIEVDHFAHSYMWLKQKNFRSNTWYHMIFEASQQIQIILNHKFCVVLQILKFWRHQLPCQILFQQSRYTIKPLPWFRKFTSPIYAIYAHILHIDCINMYRLYLLYTIYTIRCHTNTGR